MSKKQVPIDAELAEATALQRYQEGWRQGKPVEDPDKLKRWGFVTAKPSEYLIVVHNGRIDMRRSGQGMRAWKWPWQAVAIVPTTLQQIDFMADQITRERVGVTVSGIAVYRIAQPELAYRVLNFTYGERASEKLACTLREVAASGCSVGRDGEGETRGHGGVRAAMGCWRRRWRGLIQPPKQYRFVPLRT